MHWRLTVALLSLAASLAPGSARGAAPAARRIDSLEHVRFDIPAAPLVRSVEIFGSQSGLQVVYASSYVEGIQLRAFKSNLAPARALDALLQGSGLSWAPVGLHSVVILPARFARYANQMAPPRARYVPQPLEEVLVTAAPTTMLPPESSGFSVGFNKLVQETPRSISLIEGEALDRLGSFADNLANFAPSAHTTTRFGISGATDVRNIPADVYFRGMKRLTLRGHARKVSAAMDSIELVGGPAPPIYGMGKLGGYVNVVPKSGRAAEGAYLEEPQGYAQIVFGDYAKRDVSFGYGGPIEFLGASDRRGGFYVYGMVEDSGSFAEYVPIEQRLLQAATSIDDVVGNFRLEAGVFLQKARTSGALLGRLTQDVIDDGGYVRGTPLVPLDTDGSGSISYAEMQAGSPVAGALSPYNQPLMQSFAWPRDAGGEPLLIRDFPRVGGIPATLYDYLQAHPEADPGGALRAQGIGGVRPVSGTIPIGMALDPRTVGFDTLDLRRSAAFEQDLYAEFVTAYLDLVDDHDPRFTVRNQLFFDGMKHYKKSYQPYAQQQDAYVLEERLTLTRRIDELPDWIQAKVLLAANLRRTRSAGRSSGIGDFANSRTDAMADTWLLSPGGLIPNTTFVNALDNADPTDGGYPWVRSYRTVFTERGIGMMADVDLGPWVNLLFGGRYDDTSARNVDYAGRFDPDYGTASSPGRFLGVDDVASARRGAPSWSASLSVNLTPDIRPYVTLSRASLMLDGDDNSLTNSVIRAGHVGQGELREVGVKARLFDRRLSFAASAFRQTRVDVGADSDVALIEAYATATVTRGWSAELKWLPIPALHLSGYASAQSTYYEPNVGGPQLVDATTLGFTDVVDAEGTIVYPANAFLYGGRAWLLLPDGVDAYAKKQGNPDVLIGLNGTWLLGGGGGTTLGLNHTSRTCSGRLCTVVLPSATTVRIGAFVERPQWTARLDIYNLFDVRLFRARIDDALGNTSARALPDRTIYVTLKYNF